MSFLTAWQRKENSRADARLRVDPDRAAVPLDMFLNNCQTGTHTSAILVASVQPLEHAKDLIEVPCLNPYAIVSNIEDRMP